PRRAAVSAFGISGTNAHTILEQAPPTPDTPTAEPRTTPPALISDVVPLPFSARTEPALRATADRLRALLTEPGAPGLADTAGTLAAVASRWERRGVVLRTDTDSTARTLAMLSAGEPPFRDAAVTGTTAALGRIAWIFPGQGAQWAGMAAELLESSPVFAERMRACADALAPHVDWPLLEMVLGAEDDPRWERVDVVQPVSWAVMVSLAALWRSCGVVPAAVAGHSQGEIAAAVVAGALSLDDGARVVAVRARLIAEELAGTGGMAGVGLSAEDVAALPGPWGPRLSVAAVNGPTSTVVSGDADALDRLGEECERTGVRHRRLPVDYASHSGQVERIRDRLLAELAGISPRDGDIPLYSTATGSVLDTAGMTPEYWYTNLRGTVRFAPVVEDLLSAGHDILLEISSHPVLVPGMRETAETVGTDAAVLGTLRRGEGGAPRFLAALAGAFVAGAPVDWSAVGPADGAPPTGARVALPTYPFQGQRFWPTPARRSSPPDHAALAGAGLWQAVDDGDREALAAELAVPADRSVDTTLTLLSDWRRRAQESATLDSWRYAVTWAPLPDRGTVPALDGPWVVVAPAAEEADGTVEDVLAALAAAGADLRVLRVPADGADRAALGAGLAGILDDGPAPAGALSLLALAPWSVPSAHPVVPWPLAASLALTQAVHDVGCPVPLWTVTRAAVCAAPGDRAPLAGQSSLWALGRVAGLEHPASWGGLVDLPADLGTTALRRLCGVLAAPGDEQELAVRSAGTLARRLVPAPVTPARPARPWQPRGTVLITGGTGALGAHVARRLAGLGADHLLLVSRRGPGADGVADLTRELGDLGAGRVSVVGCDITDRAALAALLADVPEDLPVTGVVHAAGVGDTTRLADTDLAAFAATVAAKTEGARHLDALLEGHGLDALVYFSSGAAVWGSEGSGAYAAGNAFLDALAEEQRARGVAATSIAWGGWAGGGMVDDSVERRLNRAGVRSMDPESAVTALLRAVEHDETTVTVTDMDWAVFARSFTAARPRPLIQDLPGVAAASPEETAPEEDRTAELRHRLAEADGGERRRIVLDIVRTAASRALGHGDPGAIAAGKPFRDLGVDSLTAVDLRDRIANATGLTLPTTLVFDHPTPTAIAELLTGTLLTDESPAPPASAHGTAPAVPPAVATGNDPIAIVGMACRLPGGADTPEALWRLLADGTDAIGGFPEDRGWDLGALRAAVGDFPLVGGFLSDVAGFDAGFFGISPREALAMDPQQRLLLEVAWETVERSGIDPSSLRGSDTGVFVGAGSHDYADLVKATEDGRDYALTGAVGSVLSGRVAYALGLEGPAVTVDTACSSSLVALHLATRALRNGECSLALAGG
ncbi:SDR family NAD(P)-dependent oxidoreductase, partial [Streptomyces sp. NPDC059092]|uniref:SDR family NAD(P)-dependent oxidoreductase n=1 Tax=Streptomyces sp. NPDC059092 TaxID=3346725 RepID=UPI0036745AB3